jgi:hypothetical protein
MRVIKPLEITDSRLTSSSIAEPDTGESSWNAATSYSLGDVVIRSTTHKKYENILAGVDAGIPENTPLRWIEIGSTNRWAMFDTLRNTQSVKASPVTVTLTPSARVDSIGILSVDADEVNIVVMNGIDEVYNETQTLNSREVFDWYDYYFEEFVKVPNLVRFNLPPYATGVITITFTSVSPVKVGAIVIGNETYLGKATHGALSEELNFSRIEREVTGESLLLQRRSVPKISARTIADKLLINKIRATRKDLNAIPAVWSGLDDKQDNEYFETMLLLGVYKRFEINLDNNERVSINLEIEDI